MMSRLKVIARPTAKRPSRPINQLGMCERVRWLRIPYLRPTWSWSRPRRTGPEKMSSVEAPVNWPKGSAELVASNPLAGMMLSRMVVLFSLLTQLASAESPKTQSSGRWSKE